MRIPSTIATVAFLVAGPCMAQTVIIAPPGSDPAGAANHAARAQRQEDVARRDEYKARADASVGNYGAAAREQARAQDHQEAAQH